MPSLNIFIQGLCLPLHRIFRSRDKIGIVALFTNRNCNLSESFSNSLHVTNRGMGSQDSNSGLSGVCASSSKLVLMKSADPQLLCWLTMSEPLLSIDSITVNILAKIPWTG